jgi:hypothetical protein
VKKPHRIFPFAILAVIATIIPALAQYGTAPSGYYPVGYTGATFTGTLVSATQSPELITLRYTNGAKTDDFIGRPESTCAGKVQGGVAQQYHLSQVPKGTVLTVFYTTATSKDKDGQKNKEHVIFTIEYVELGGKTIPADKRGMVSCSAAQATAAQAH